MPLIPFRAKNPPERFPAMTVCLIVMNVVVYLLTANLDRGSASPDNPFLFIRPSVATAFAVSWETLGSAPWRLLTHAFLHADPFHLFGNLLLLWVFGPAVEGRLGHAKFSGLYAVTALFAGFFQTLVAGVLNPEQFVIGASGAIMGVSGAYLFIFPFATIVCVVLVPYSTRFTLSKGVIHDIAAQWVVLFAFVGDLWAAVSSDGYSGVANFAHIGGLLCGFGGVALLKTRRDGRRVSDARKMQAEGVNLSALSVAELSSLLTREPENEKLILAYGERVTDRATPDYERLFADALHRFGYVIAEKMDAQTLGVIAAGVSPDTARLPASPLLQVGARLERGGKPGDLRVAAQLYRTLFKQEKSGSDAEIALLKYAQVTGRLVTERLSDNPNEPIVLYQTFLRRFPASPHIFAAQEDLKRLGGHVPDGF